MLQDPGWSHPICRSRKIDSTYRPCPWDEKRVEIRIWLTLKVNKEAALQFMGKIQAVLTGAATQNILVGDYRRISFSFLVSLRMDRGFPEGLSFSQVSGICL